MSVGLQRKDNHGFYFITLSSSRVSVGTRRYENIINKSLTFLYVSKPSTQRQSRFL